MVLVRLTESEASALVRAADGAAETAEKWGTDPQARESERAMALVLHEHLRSGSEKIQRELHRALQLRQKRAQLPEVDDE